MRLADQADRDRIEHSLGETLFVEAGAGTGKTHQLVQRIVNLIASGEVQASQIAAITFTEKAAAELYDRVLEELDQQRESTSDPFRQALFAEAAEQLDYAAIETLHAFAGRILRLHPIEAGLPPGFRIVDESEAALNFAVRWEEALDEILEDESLAEPLLTAFDAGIELSNFEEVARQLHQDWDRAERDDAEMKPGDADVLPLIDDLRGAIEQRRNCVDQSDKLYLRLIRLQSFLQRLEDAQGEPGTLVRLLQHTTPTSLRVGNVGRKANWPGDAHLPIREMLSRLDKQRELLRSQIILNCCAPVANQIRRIVVDYADERRRSGELEFQDLLVRASRLLESDQSVASSVRDRFTRLLIDEFQDNDPLQTRIIDAITRGEPGRAFYVGDPKQSIYRFRRADIQQFNRVRSQHDGSRPQLTQNFRSTPGVTSFVNAVFRPMMAAGAPDQAAWEDLHPDREDQQDLEHAVTIIGDELDGTIERTRAREADALTRLIADITASRWQVFDKALSDRRDARHADTAVLVPTRRGLNHLLPALEERDIPYRLESRSLVYNTREIRDLLNLLHAIDDPTDQVALVAALRSPAFACADDDLYRWTRGGGRWDYRRDPRKDFAEDDPVADSMHWLRDKAERRWEMSVSELLGSIIRERRLMELAVVERQPREHWARYRFLLDQARAFCDNGGSTLSEFLAWTEHQAEADTQVIESVVPEEDHDAVRIMTIHAAKGLEFPIVVFTGLNSQPRLTAPPLLWSETGPPEIHLRRGLETPGFAALWEREQELFKQEYVRRNYVGASRARDHLIVSLFRKTGEQCDAALIAEAIRESRAPCRWLAPELIPDPPRPEQNAALTEPTETAADREQWIARRQAAIQQYATLPRESATGVAKIAAGESTRADRQPNHEPDDDLPPWRRGRAGTAIGRATHAVLQVIDLQNPDQSQTEQAARAQAAAESLTSRAAETVARLAARATRSQVVEEAVAANRYWRELYAAVEVDGVLLDGFIDLLYELPNGNLVVVDYKTDALQSGESVAAALQRYRLQAASYALILEESLQRTVERCVLLLLEPDEEVEIPDLPGAIADVRLTLADSISITT